LTRTANHGFAASCSASPDKWRNEDALELQAGGLSGDRVILANTDLPERLRRRALLNRDDPSTYYGRGERGYTDYPNPQPGTGRDTEALRGRKVAMMMTRLQCARTRKTRPLIGPG